MIVDANEHKREIDNNDIKTIDINKPTYFLKNGLNSILIITKQPLLR